MSFWDEVYLLREQGAIPRVWTRDCLRAYLLGAYRPNSINTIPSNASMARDGKQIGNYVKNGQEAKAWRVGPGKFQLVIDPDDDDAVQYAERRRAQAYAHIARARAAGNPYPLQGLPLKYDRPFDPVDIAEARANAAGVNTAAQIRQLKDIPSDWHHDEPGSAPDPDGLEWLAGRFESHYPPDAPPPYIFPNPEGTVTALWKIDADIQVEVEFNLAAGTAERWIHSISALTAQYDIVDLKAADALSDIGVRNVELAAVGC